MGSRQSGMFLRFPKRLRFGVASRVGYTQDGILGLAFPRDPAETRGTNILAECVRTGLFRRAVFTTFLRRCATARCADAGQVRSEFKNLNFCSGQKWCNTIPIKNGHHDQKKFF